jgi:SAM-dependent methyltransferase
MLPMDTIDLATSWNAEYRSGRYDGEAPVSFTWDILATARSLSLTSGLYIGCGNGRNYLPLVDGGLDLLGLDISSVAIAQLAARAPARRDRLLCGDLTALPAEQTYPLVIGIQVFQHGDRSATHANIRAAQERVTPGGLFCLRVNAVGSHIWPAHVVTEQHDDQGLTVLYHEGPKRGLQIHFFGADELRSLFERAFEAIRPLKLSRHLRTPPAPGSWAQWEGIWKKVVDVTDPRATPRDKA